mgnify:FL=1
MADYANKAGWDRYQQNLAAITKPDEQDKAEALKEARTYAKSILDAAEMYLQSGKPLKDFPSYQDIITSQGQNVKEQYQKYVTTQEKQSKMLKELKTHAGTEAGRIKLQQAVDEGLLTAEEAFGDNPSYQQYTGELKQAMEKQKAGVLRDVRTPEGRQNLADVVTSGDITQQEAFGPGSAWEKWQHKMAERPLNPVSAKLTQPEDLPPTGQITQEDITQGMKQIRPGAPGGIEDLPPGMTPRLGFGADLSPVTRDGVTVSVPAGDIASVANAEGERRRKIQEQYLAKWRDLVEQARSRLNPPQRVTRF